jgi:hypothetical protein
MHVVVKRLVPMVGLPFKHAPEILGAVILAMVVIIKLKTKRI